MPIALGEGAPRCRALDHDLDSRLAEDWRLFRTQGSTAARNRLVGHYMKRQVRPIASRIHAGLPRVVDLDDLVQQGYLGLIDAMHRFDAERHTRFETFSRQRIFGAIQDYLRSIDPMPRLARSRRKQVQSERDQFRVRHGRPPTDQELRERLDLPAPVLERLLVETGPSAVVSFSSVGPDASDGDDDDGDAMHGFEDDVEPNPLHEAERRDVKRWLSRGFDQRDRLILVLYYWESMTMGEVGRTIGISESRVSQRLESILACLRAKLARAGVGELV